MLQDSAFWRHGIAKNAQYSPANLVGEVNRAAYRIDIESMHEDRRQLQVASKF
jgi:hypothetical protein